MMVDGVWHFGEINKEIAKERKLPAARKVEVTLMENARRSRVKRTKADEGVEIPIFDEEEEEEVCAVVSNSVVAAATNMVGV